MLIDATYGTGRLRARHSPAHSSLKSPDKMGRSLPISAHAPTENSNTRVVVTVHLHSELLIAWCVPALSVAPTLRIRWALEALDPHRMRDVAARGRRGTSPACADRGIPARAGCPASRRTMAATTASLYLSNERSSDLVSSRV